jgi:hypothetical protein
MLLCLIVLVLKVPNLELPDPNTNLNSAGVAGVPPKLVAKLELNAANSFSRTAVVAPEVRKALTGKI